MSAAERMALARREFVEAMEANLSIPELRARKAHLRWLARNRQAQFAAEIADADRAVTDFRDWNAKWMGRD